MKLRRYAVTLSPRGDWEWAAESSVPVGLVPRPTLKLSDTCYNFDEVVDVLDALTLRNAPLAVKISAGVFKPGGVILLYTADVKDRDHGHPLQLEKRSGLSLPLRVEDLLGIIRHDVQALYAHEIDETFVYDGNRLFDPHAGEK